MALLSLSLSAAERSLADNHLETGITNTADFIYVALSLIDSCAFASPLLRPVRRVSLLADVTWNNTVRRTHA